VAQSIYCDESGFSGNNLLDPGQPYFTYASVAIEDSDARELAAKTLADYRIDGEELKAQRLLRYSRGRKAITHVLETTVDRALVSAWHKRYSLASKFFEHIFEPVLAERNSIFYNVGFHRFISNIIYFEALANSRRAVNALEAFQAALRNRDSTAVSKMFPDVGLREEYSGVLKDIETFAVCHQEAIARDIADYSGDEPLYAWLLDLSVSALFALLTAWGQKFDSLVVYCDDSKPLWQARESFDMMIGRSDKAYVTFEGKRQSLIFNLAEPLHFVSSTTHPGIQVADIFSSTLAYCLRQPKDDQTRRWLRCLTPAVSEFSVFPDEELVDLEEEKTAVNALILCELVERSLKKRDLFDEMPEFIRVARRVVASHRINPPGK
jgi:hypothetical protein